MLKRRMVLRMERCRQTDDVDLPGVGGDSSAALPSTGVAAAQPGLEKSSRSMSLAGGSAFAGRAIMPPPAAPASALAPFSSMLSRMSVRSRVAATPRPRNLPIVLTIVRSSVLSSDVDMCL